MKKPRRGSTVEPASADPIDRRLARIEGQVGGIRKMAASKRECVDILMQLAATRAAIEQVSVELLTHHISDCPKGSGCVSEQRSTELSEEEWKEQARRILGWFIR